MGHITSVGAGIYSDLSISQDATNTPAACLANPIAATWAAAFATAQAVSASASTAGMFKRIQNVREFPQMGVPPNIVNVPKYGSKASVQVQGQADAPSFEVTLNYISDDWITANLGAYVGSGNPYCFRFALLNSEPTGWASSAASIGTAKAGGTMGNSLYYWVGKMEALQINPQLTDANQATLTISIQSDFYGAFTGA